MRKGLEIGITLGMVAVAVVLVVGRQERNTGAGVGPLSLDAPTMVAQTTTDLPPADTLAEWLRLGHNIGPDLPMVRIIEFGNFTCGFCLQFAASIDTVQRRYPGLVGVTWLHFVFDSQLVRPNSTTFLANASECLAAQGLFGAFYRAVMLDGATLESRREIVAWAEARSATDRFTAIACLESRGGMPRVLAHARQGAKAGTNATPTWYLNGKRFIGAVPTVVLDSLVRDAMRSANEAG